MTMNKLLGVLLLLVAAGVVAGLVMDITWYWFDLDYVTIVVNVVAGLYLLTRKS